MRQAAHWGEAKRLFLRGYEEMMKRLEPQWVIFYGKVPEECDWNVIRVPPHYDEIVKRRSEVKMPKFIDLTEPVRGVVRA